ncbi:hypothetical protein M404DRAFT_1006648 [Pisolithus tinctorius Marx 270]|uniref:Uncharacterized protein n=1 Tax=Pisolithus tinctorius Marx 270 TaxID=870435 RepID=A0A0C3N6D5_PISTI|nr:hypothetical protein M404DRAFT_1006648 [Pisolithus tinctorius Marx 270]
MSRTDGPVSYSFGGIQWACISKRPHRPVRSAQRLGLEKVRTDVESNRCEPNLPGRLPLSDFLCRA